MPYHQQYRNMLGQQLQVLEPKDYINLIRTSADSMEKSEFISQFKAAHPQVYHDWIIRQHQQQLQQHRNNQQNQQQYQIQHQQQARPMLNNQIQHRNPAHFIPSRTNQANTNIQQINRPRIMNNNVNNNNNNNLQQFQYGNTMRLISSMGNDFTPRSINQTVRPNTNNFIPRQPIPNQLYVGNNSNSKNNNNSNNVNNFDQN
jgi:hypothetical protein